MAVISLQVMNGNEIMCRKNWSFKVMMKSTIMRHSILFTFVDIFGRKFDDQGLYGFALAGSVQMPVGPSLDFNLDLGCT